MERALDLDLAREPSRFGTTKKKMSGRKTNDEKEERSNKRIKELTTPAMSNFGVLS
jgi:hypothetical protein